MKTTTTLTVAANLDDNNSLIALAEACKAAARVMDKSEEGKAFISDVAALLGCDLALLKTYLVEMNRRGLVELNRCDLVQAYPVATVAASEIAVHNATFHRVRVD